MRSFGNEKVSIQPNPIIYLNSYMLVCNVFGTRKTLKEERRIGTFGKRRIEEVSNQVC
jgi:hypothetical protein